MSKKNKGTKNVQEMGNNNTQNAQNTQGTRMDDNAKKQGGAQSKNEKGCR